MRGEVGYAASLHHPQAVVLCLTPAANTDNPVVVKKKRGGESTLRVPVDVSITFGGVPDSRPRRKATVNSGQNPQPTGKGGEVKGATKRVRWPGLIGWVHAEERNWPSLLVPASTTIICRALRCLRSTSPPPFSLR